MKRATFRRAVTAFGVALSFVLRGHAATGTIQDVQHVVIFVQENRSFDHYYGSLHGVCGFGDRSALVFTNGNPDFYQPLGTNFVLPFHVSNQCLADVAHDEGSGEAAWHGGKWDQWMTAKGTNAMPFLARADLPYYYALAEAYTICDAYHCSVLGPTYPNRLYLWTGMVDPNATGGGPVLADSVPTNGFTWTTYPERLQAAGISWRVYQQNADFYGGNALTWFAQYKNAKPSDPLYARGVALVTNLVAAFQADVSNGTLPQVSWIVPPWTLSEHPFYSPASGESLTKQLLDAVASNPAVYNSTVFFFTYDENGGFYDHVPPPVPPPGTTNEFVKGLPIGLGTRVPMIVVSPWSRGGYVCSQVFDHTSILQFLERWTGVQEPNISAWRRQVCGDLTTAFDFTRPNTNLPSLPSVTAVPCTLGAIPQVPSPQTVPTQETNATLARPLPYQPNAASFINCTTGRIYITLTNSGAASVHFAIYPNAYRADGPWQYDVRPNGSLTDSFDIIALGGGFYDLTCYGPNGFQRRFAGNSNTDCNQLEVTSACDLNAGGLTLTMRNATAAPAVFTVSNGYATGGPWSYTVPAGTVISNTFLVVTNNNGWYDLTATANTDTTFLRRLVGHIETGLPRLSATVAGGNLTLKYPGWANAYTLETRMNLRLGTWATVSNTPILSNNSSTLTLPVTPGSRFFRLRN